MHTKEPREQPPQPRVLLWGHKKGCSQSRCFFLGPITSCVVALQTALATADPVTLYWAAAMRSVSVWPDIFAGVPAAACSAEAENTGGEGEIPGLSPRRGGDAGGRTQQRHAHAGTREHGHTQPRHTHNGPSGNPAPPEVQLPRPVV